MGATSVGTPSGCRHNEGTPLEAWSPARAFDAPLPVGFDADVGARTRRSPIGLNLSRPASDLSAAAAAVKAPQAPDPVGVD